VLKFGFKLDFKLGLKFDLKLCLKLESKILINFINTQTTTTQNF